MRNYGFVNITINGKNKPFYVHRLVAEAFIQTPKTSKCGTMEFGGVLITHAYLAQNMNLQSKRFSQHVSSTRVTYRKRVYKNSQGNIREKIKLKTLG